MLPPPHDVGFMNANQKGSCGTSALKWSDTALVSGTSLLFLTLPGGLAAHAGGAGVVAGAIRVGFWGAIAMAVTAGVGALFGTVA
jgi:hypothetical protein